VLQLRAIASLVTCGLCVAQNLHPQTGMRLFSDFFFLFLFFVFLGVWLVSWLAFHVAGGLIHILVVIAVISLILHFVRGSRGSA
jgi:hypothetical protein